MPKVVWKRKSSAPCIPIPIRGDDPGVFSERGERRIYYPRPFRKGVSQYNLQEGRHRLSIREQIRGGTYLYEIRAGETIIKTGKLIIIQ
jgi:hypothetical protein